MEHGFTMVHTIFRQDGPSLVFRRQARSSQEKIFSKTDTTMQHHNPHGQGNRFQRRHTIRSNAASRQSQQPGTRRSCCCRSEQCRGSCLRTGSDGGTDSAVNRLSNHKAGSQQQFGGQQSGGKGFHAYRWFQQQHNKRKGSG